MIRDCPDNKKFIIRMPKKENREDKHKFFKDGLFAMTHSNAQATFDVVTCTI